MIEFIEKEPWTSHDSLYKRTYAGNFMVKDGVEYFMVNRVVLDIDPCGFGRYHCDESIRKLEEIKAFLTKNDGKYFKFHGAYEDPFKMLEDIEKRGHTLWSTSSLFIDCLGIKAYGGGFVDFGGNRNEESAAFRYRIYDMSMVEALEKAAAPIIGRTKRCAGDGCQI